MFVTAFAASFRTGAVNVDSFSSLFSSSKGVFSDYMHRSSPLYDVVIKEFNVLLNLNIVDGKMDPSIWSPEQGSINRLEVLMVNLL